MNGIAQIDPGGGLIYEVLLPSFVASRMGGQIGETITLHTLHLLEGSSQGTSFVPRLIGFQNELDRAFFSTFTSVKGIGPKKALRAMSMSTGQIAAAIADRDTKMLQSMPEIGKRMAETIVATLHGKVDRFLSETSYPASAAGGKGEPQVSPAMGAAREALEVLLQLGEQRAAAMAWIDQVLIKNPKLERDATQIVQEVLRLKGGG